MDKHNLVFNTLVSQKRINNGIKQHELFDEILSLGFNSIEVRRELFSNIKEEISKISNLAKDKGIELFYSVPDQIFLEGGGLNPKISEYFEEGELLGALNIKMTIGDYQYPQQLEKLKFINNQPFKFTVENDQTQQSGTINNIKSFLEDAKDAGLNIGYTFDLGNFRYVHENEVDGADTLSTFTTYIHLKNVSEDNGELIATSLGKGIIDWKTILNKLPAGLPIALEYPSNNNDEILKDKNSIEVIENERQQSDNKR
ncbi:sugar phosphate isomerase/epimerase family protein [Staphylococcus arlettae]|uniref:sugar phosphate isomerase/epimerase family protein n=1 Tax=Staphylococcus TaxID=1279 RepID=UPI000E6A33B2|nr:sugar phosphate isomerase/epimerase [Staphylococcus arlettae]RIM60496.1 sugar phosphate isomerase/epimerase [Staphylococcus arlettae]